MFVEDYLLCKWISWGKVSITLAVDGGVTTSTNGIHLPVSVVIVYDMKIPMSAPAFFLCDKPVSYQMQLTQIHNKRLCSDRNYAKIRTQRETMFFKAPFGFQCSLNQILVCQQISIQKLKLVPDYNIAVKMQGRSPVREKIIPSSFHPRIGYRFKKNIVILRPIMYLPRHSLDKALSKVVVGDGDLHLLVSNIGITMTQQHHLLIT